MFQIKTIKNIIKECDWKYIMITCPFFKNWKCSIYENRPSCCKNYPQKDAYCTNKKCKLWVKNIDWKLESSNPLCFECKKKCCERILVPVWISIDKDFILDWLNIDCKNCKKLFFNRDQFL
jgi:Fe-S-cluster containining protein